MGAGGVKGLGGGGGGGLIGAGGTGALAGGGGGGTGFGAGGRTGWGGGTASFTGAGATTGGFDGAFKATVGIFWDGAAGAGIAGFLEKSLEKSPGAAGLAAAAGAFEASEPGT